MLSSHLRCPGGGPEGTHRRSSALRRANRSRWELLARSRRSALVWTLEGGEDGAQDPQRPRRAAWHCHIHGNDVRDAAAARIAFAKNAAGTTAVPDRDHEFWVRRRFVRTPQCNLHVLRHRPGHEQQVRVTRARDESDAETLEVVDGVVEGMNLELAAVAGARIHLPNAERTAEDSENARLQRLAQ